MKRFCSLLLNCLILFPFQYVFAENETTIKMEVSNPSLKMLNQCHMIESGYKSFSVNKIIDRKLEDISVAKISEEVKKVKTALCDIVKPGEIKFWLKLEAGSVFFTSGSGGIEVTIKCN